MDEGPGEWVESDGYGSRSSCEPYQQENLSLNRLGT